jgi:hypothetical protein
MAPEISRDHPDYTVHVFVEHGWTEIAYVLSDLRNAIAVDHQADHERVDHRPGFALPRPHSHRDERSGEAAD